MREVIAWVDGIGRLERAGHVEISPVRYQLSVIQNVSDDPGAEGDGLETQGTLVGAGIIPAALIGAPVELVLDDGRRLSCTIVSPDGSLAISEPISNLR